MKEDLFRKKSMDKVSSPEQLNQYVRVSSPALWMILTAVILILVGVCVWGIFGSLETTVKTAGICKDGTLICYVKERDIASVDESAKVMVENQYFEIKEIASEPFVITDEMNVYVFHLGNLQSGEWVYPVSVKTSLPDGTYDVSLTIESIAPISFVWR